MKSIINQCLSFKEKLSSLENYYTQTIQDLIFNQMYQYTSFIMKLQNYSEELQSYSNHTQNLMIGELENILIHFQKSYNQLEFGLYSYLKQFKEFQECEIMNFLDFKKNYESLLKIDKINENMKLFYQYDFYEELDSRILKFHANPILQISAQQQLIFTSSCDQTICIINSNLTLIQHLKGFHKSWIRCLTMNNQYLVSGGDDSEINVFDLQSNEIVLYQQMKNISGKGYIKYLILANNNNIICSKSMSADYDLFIYHINSGDLLQRIKLHRNDCYFIAQLNENCYLSVDRDCNIYKWTIKNNKFKILGRWKFYGAYTIFHQDEVLYVGTNSGRIKIINISNMKVMRVLRLVKLRIEQLQVIQKQLIAFYCKSSKFYVYDTKNWEMVFQFKQYDLQISRFYVNIDLAYIIFGSDQGEIKKYEFKKQVSV